MLDGWITSNLYDDWAQTISAIKLSAVAPQTCNANNGARMSLAVVPDFGNLLW